MNTNYRGIFNILRKKGAFLSIKSNFHHFKGLSIKQIAQCFFGRWGSEFKHEEYHENKRSWKTIKPFLSEQVTAQTSLSLVENGKFLSNEAKTAETFNDFLKMLLTN